MSDAFGLHPVRRAVQRIRRVCTLAPADGHAEAGARGVRVNAAAPGMTDTPMTAGMLKMPAMREGAARQYPLGGVQTAEQVADVMAWLLSLKP